MTREFKNANKIIYFIFRVLVLGRDHISHVSATLSIYSTLIAIVLRDYGAAMPLLIYLLIL